MSQTEVLYQTYDYSGTDDKPDGVSTWNTHYRIVLNTKRKATTGLRGELKSQSCTLSEALVNYRVIINDRTIVLPDLPQMSNLVVQRIEREAEWGRQQGAVDFSLHKPTMLTFLQDSHPLWVAYGLLTRTNTRQKLT